MDGLMDGWLHWLIDRGIWKFWDGTASVFSRHSVLGRPAAQRSIVVCLRSVMSLLHGLLSIRYGLFVNQVLAVFQEVLRDFGSMMQRPVVLGHLACQLGFGIEVSGLHCQVKAGSGLSTGKPSSPKLQATLP